MSADPGILDLLTTLAEIDALAARIPSRQVRISFLGDPPAGEEFRLTGFSWEPGGEIEYVDEVLDGPRP